MVETKIHQISKETVDGATKIYRISKVIMDGEIRTHRINKEIMDGATKVTPIMDGEVEQVMIKIQKDCVILMKFIY